MLLLNYLSAASPLPTSPSFIKPTPNKLLGPAKRDFMKKKQHPTPKQTRKT